MQQLTVGYLDPGGGMMGRPVLVGGGGGNGGGSGGGIEGGDFRSVSVIS